MHVVFQAPLDEMKMLSSQDVKVDRLGLPKLTPEATNIVCGSSQISSRSLTSQCSTPFQEYFWPIIPGKTEYSIFACLLSGM